MFTKQKHNKIITENVRKLVTKLTGFKEPDKSFAIYEEFALTNIKYHRFLSVDSHAVKRSMNGLVEKFRIHGHSDAAHKLRELFDSFVEEVVFKDHEQYDLEWALLRLIINLAYNPTGAIRSNGGVVLSIPFVKEGVEKESEEDWDKLLRDGIDLRSNYDSISESEWTTDSDSESPANCGTVNNQQVTALYSSNSKTSNNTSSIKSEEWLSQNLQSKWWIEGTSCSSKSTIRAANLAREWNAYYARLSYGLLEHCSASTIPEYCVIREILWMLQVPSTRSGKLFFRNNNEFQIRDNVSINSLTTPTFQALLCTFCKCISIIYEFEQFGISLQGYYNEQMAPFTYEAYNEAIKFLLQPFKCYLIELEDTVKVQEDIFTVIALQNALKSHFDFIQSLWFIHQRCVVDWKTASQSYCSITLLTKLYEGCYTLDIDLSRLSFVLFIKTVKVYLNIIQIWLAEGRLEDWRKEFIIEPIQDEAGFAAGFSLKTSDKNIDTTGPLFDVLISKVLKAGQSVHILQQLDRMSDMQKQSYDNLYEVYVSSVLKELDLFELKLKSKNNELCLAIPSKSSGGYTSVHSNDSEQQNSAKSSESNSFIPEVKDEILRMVFKKYLRKETSNDVNIECNNNSKCTNDIFQLYERLKSSNITQFKNIINKVFNNLLNNNCMESCKLVAIILKQDCQLQNHLNGIQSVILMQASYPMYHFHSQLFTEIENGYTWSNPYYLTTQLENNLVSRFGDIAHQFSISLSGNTSAVSCLIAIDCITISYGAQYPLSLIITPDSLIKYNECMRFILKVKWGLWTVQNLRFSELARGEQSQKKSDKLNIRRLQMLRFWILHAVGSIHNYIVGQVLIAAEKELELEIESAVVLEDIIAAHNNFLKLIRSHCMLSSKHKEVYSAIMELLKLVQVLRAEWRQFSEDEVDSSSESRSFDGEQISSMETAYIKCHKFLGDTFRSSLESGGNDHLLATVEISNKHCFCELESLRFGLIGIGSCPIKVEMRKKEKTSANIITPLKGLTPMQSPRYVKLQTSSRNEFLLDSTDWSSGTNSDDSDSDLNITLTNAIKDILSSTNINVMDSYDSDDIDEVFFDCQDEFVSESQAFIH